MAKILIVDDEEKIRNVVKEYAFLNGYDVDEAEDGLKCLELVKENDYDCIVLDLMLPKLDGFSVLKKIKEQKETPIIILSARTNEDDKLFTLENGSDDYVTKPFSPKELLVRIKKIIQRNSKNENTNYEFGGLKIDVLGRTITIDGKRTNMTPKEIDLLIFLVKNQNIAISRERLLNSLWKYDYYGDDRTIDTHIKMLRKNLGPYKDYIVTIRGMGYKFEV